MVLCNLKDADLFHLQFGGERVTITVTRPVRSGFEPSVV